MQMIKWRYKRYECIRLPLPIHNNDITWQCNLTWKNDRYREKGQPGGKNSIRKCPQSCSRLQLEDAATDMTIKHVTSDWYKTKCHVALRHGCKCQYIKYRITCILMHWCDKWPQITTKPSSWSRDRRFVLLDQARDIEKWAQMSLHSWTGHM